MYTRATYIHDIVLYTSYNITSSTTTLVAQWYIRAEDLGLSTSTFLYLTLHTHTYTHIHTPPTAHSNRVTALKFVADEDWILSVSRDKYFQWHCTKTGRKLGSFEGHAWCLAVEYPLISN